MNILVASDLHREFDGWQDFDKAAIARADVVVLAGDIDLAERGITWADAYFRGKPVVYVPGNHELYEGHWTATLETMRLAAKGTHVHLLEDDAVVIDGVRFVGTTLWTDFALDGRGNVAKAMEVAVDLMQDYRLIRITPATPAGVARLRPEDTRERFASSRAWLAAALAQPHDGPTVVVTHHLPHRGSIAPRWQGSGANPSFASDLSDLIERHAPALWIHGHTHDSTDYRVGATRVVCNPKGYPQRTGGYENPVFDRAFNVDVTPAG